MGVKASAIENLLLVTSPDGCPVTLDQAKAHLNVQTGQWDDLISELIETATGDLDGKSGSLFRCLLPQTWRQYVDYTFPVCAEGMIELPLGPVRSVTSITYVDSNGDTQTVGTDIYEFYPADGLGVASVGLKFLQSWPDVRCQRRAIAITYEAGYADSRSVPSALRSAIMMHVTHLFENRGNADAPDLPPSYLHLITKYRRINI